jgi:hypothetical protein
MKHDVDIVVDDDVVDDDVDDDCILHVSMIVKKMVCILVIVWMMKTISRNLKIYLLDNFSCK